MDAGTFCDCFPAMGGAVEVVLPAGDAARATRAVRRIRRTFARHEAVLSRFRSESELCALNRSGGRPFVASPLLFAAVGAALAAAEASGGLYDPTILPELEAAGYDRTFAQLGGGTELGSASQARMLAALGPRPHPSPLPLGEGIRAQREWHPLSFWERARVRARPQRRGFRDIRLAARTRTIYLPAGMRLDLGGIGKGWTVDRAARRVRDLSGGLINAGGDLYAYSGPAPGHAWRVGVEDPLRPGSDLTTLLVRDRAVATSGRNRRRWRRAGQPAHHLIDPRTGRPSTSDLLAVTVVGERAAAAEVLAKVAFLMGMEAGLAYLEHTSDCDGLLVGEGGAVRWTRGLERYFGDG
jgi:thiamine biosynthesis lipoprotein